MTARDITRPIPGARLVSLLRQRLAFTGSARYWERRYARGGTSGDGSYGTPAAAKAEFINGFVATNRINSVTEFGCGDGHQLSLASYPHYVGLDVSRAAVDLCKRRFGDDRTKSFFLYDSTCFVDHADLFRSDLAISLDVIYHLVEDDIFEAYMRHLFAAADQYAIVYASDQEMAGTAPHVRHRHFSGWIARNCPAWRLAEIVPGPNSGPGRADFFVYRHGPVI
jgi:cyclopropane fatty-acyl-phospholipid synthase-like methyltransferase